MNKLNIIAFQIDDLSNLNMFYDTSLIIAYELQQRGFEIFFYHPNDIRWIDNAIIAQGKKVRIKYSERKKFDIDNISNDYELSLRSILLVLVRQNPPFDINYITNSYLLEELSSDTLVLNNPQSIRNCPEKLVTLGLSELIPPTIVTNNLVTLLDFLSTHKHIVLKPLYGYGGSNVVDFLYNHDHIEKLKLELEKYIATNSYSWIIAQKFLPEILKGDTRVMIVDNEILTSFKRCPKKNSFISNMVQGGVPQATSLNEKELKVCEYVINKLKSIDIFMAGLDIIDGKLIEVNVTSPTGIVQANLIYDEAFEKIVVDKIERKLIDWYKQQLDIDLNFK